MPIRPDGALGRCATLDLPTRSTTEPRRPRQNKEEGNPMESSTAQPKRFDHTQGPRILGPADGKSFDMMTTGCRYHDLGRGTGGGFSLVEHPIPPRSLVAPLHKHSREDEYSFVIEGRWVPQLGDDVVYAEAGDLAFKPRDQWHTFWNAGGTPCRILEIISPGRLRALFRRAWRAAGATGLQPRADRRARREVRTRVPAGEHAAALRGARTDLPRQVGGLSRPAGARRPSGSARGGSRAGACAAPPRRGPRRSWPRSRAPARSPCRGIRGRSDAAPRARGG